jgi:LacI family transcriptional regulator
MDSIVSDNFTGVMEAINYLIKMGHKKIAYAGGPNSHPSFKERYKAYQMEMLENKLEIKEEFIKVKKDFSQDMGKELAKEFLKEKELPTAISAANDATAIGLMQTFKKYGFDVPADISIIGFDNIELTSFTTPKITTISVDKEGMGQEAARKLFDRIQNPEKKSTKSVIPTELIERESVKEIRT